MRLRNRVALITGASRGIGATVARAYASQGASVAVNHLPTPEMESLAKECVDDILREGGTAMCIGADVSSREQTESMFRAVRETLGPVDTLVANAAYNSHQDWTTLSIDDWDRVIASNLTGTFLCVRAAYQDMLEHGYGNIITVSSVTVERGTPGCAAYIASKAGIIGLTRALARELGPHGIRVNCVMPGWIRTEVEIARYPDPEPVNRVLLQQQCIPRRGLAEDLVGAFVFLASSESDFITGQVLNVDGGWVHY